MGVKVKDFNEECWIIYGYTWRGKMFGWTAWESEGSPGSVDFNWKKVFRSKRNILGFSHTHPGGHPFPSNIDDNTMAGWVKALGKPLLCGIKSNGKQKIYLYERENSKDKHKRIICRELSFKKVGNFITIKDWIKK